MRVEDDDRLGILTKGDADIPGQRLQGVVQPAPRDAQRAAQSRSLIVRARRSSFFRPVSLHRSKGVCEEISMASCPAVSYIALFKRAEANFVPGPTAVVPPIGTTDGVNFDRRPTPEVRAALLAYLRKL